MNMQQLAKEQESYIIQARHHLHAHPELSCKETETTRFICGELEKMGIAVETFEGITGCVGTIEGAHPGKTVMLRADIDALPIQETPGKSYCSQNAGVMHACGHDCHTAMLLGAARILSSHREEIHGTVKLIFQMGEEVGRKSEEYVTRGALEGVDAIFGMHVWANLDAGTANFEVGERMACSDRFTIRVRGGEGPRQRPPRGEGRHFSGGGCGDGPSVHSQPGDQPLRQPGRHRGNDERGHKGKYPGGRDGVSGYCPCV